MNTSPRPLAWMLAFALLATLLPALALAAPAAQASKPYSGRVAQTFQNCGITQVFGTVLDANGGHQTGVRVRLWWNAANAQTLRTTSGLYVRNETGASGWDFTLNSLPTANTWLVAVEDSNGNLLSDPVEARTTSECSGPNAANVVKVEFRNAPAAPAPPAPPSGPPSGGEAAPPLLPGASCQAFSQAGRFSICDDGNARFLSAFRQYGLQNVGYPISQRYRRDGFVTQAFQKAIFQWRPDGSFVAFVNVFDDLHRRGMDQQLLSARQTPLQLPVGWEGENVPFERAVQLRQALLNERPALRRAYFAVSDPLTFFGLPTSEVEDMGNHYAIRTQRAVLQEWKQNVPWASVGQVTIANGGDIAKELGDLPAIALNQDTGGGAPVAGPPPPQPTAPPAPPAPTQPPVGSEPPRNLDPRLPALGVSVAPANVAPGQPYWRAVEVIWHDEVQAEGRHSIFVDVMDGNGGRVVGQPVTFAWGGGSVQLVIEPKPFPEYGANFPMYAAGNSYTVSVEGLPSDRVVGLGLGDLDQRLWTIHVEYLIKFQRAIR